MGWSEPLPTNDLAAFVAAVETGSIQAAADALSLSQSATTKRIQHLEARLAVSLLDRGRFGVRATAEGRTLYPDAKEALDVLKRAELRIAALGLEGAHTLRLAASHTVGGFLLPGWLSRFRAVDPALQPQVEIVNSPAVLELVGRASVDIGFVEGDDDLSGLDCLTVGLDELVVVVAPEHRWARRSALRAADLVTERFYSREPGSGTRSVAEHRLAQVDVRLEPSLQMASTESLKRAVLDGGFALLSRHAVMTEMKTGALATVQVRDVDMRRSLFAVKLRGGRSARSADRMWSWLAGQPVGAARHDAGANAQTSVSLVRTTQRSSHAAR
jgi:DNA-binding transcriptional LysR family regulator